MAQKQKAPEKVIIDDWTFRIRKPSEQRGDLTKVMILLHGHLGNENAMWILTNPLPEDYLLIAPRAPVKLGKDQYSWHKIRPQWPDLDAYQQISKDLLRRVDSCSEKQGIQMKCFDLMGFSQGAALAYALALLHPEIICRVAALAGFIPQAWKDRSHAPKLENIKFFIAHGTRDEMVPIEKGRSAATWLEGQGAQVNFCEADIGHKVSANCFKGLGKFFE